MKFTHFFIILIIIFILSLFWQSNYEKRNFKNVMVEIICLAEEIQNTENQKIKFLEDKRQRLLNKYGFKNGTELEQYFQKHMMKYMNDEELVLEIEILAEEKCGAGLNDIKDIKWNTQIKKY